MGKYVDHVFVLMLENRSFDHFFGLSGRSGIPRPTPASPIFGPGAPDQLSADPPHEFVDVQAQIHGGAMDGFDPGTGRAFEPAQIPILSQLAQEFVLFDNWFSSVPGPTWPNRFFVHAASSGGLATSPTNLQSGGSVVGLAHPWKFKNGSIYDRLDQAKLKWRIYHGDPVPQVLALPGAIDRYIGGGENFCQTYGVDPTASNFANDVSKADYEPAYTFIEPNYAVQAISRFSFTYGDSQHATGKVSAGEALIKYVYESLRKSPLWERSALLITWDEHGGFYDHVKPPQAVPPGDSPFNRPTDGSDPGFAFDRLGVRVPAVLISPLVPSGQLGSQLFPGQSFDHTSVIKSVFENFGISPALTQRDYAAPSWNGCVVTAPTGAGSTLATLNAPAQVAATPAPPILAGLAPAHIDGFLTGTMLNALSVDRALAAHTGKPSIASTTPQTARQYALAQKASLSDPHFKLDVAQYINEVSGRVRVQREKARLNAAVVAKT